MPRRHFDIPQFNRWLPIVRGKLRLLPAVRFCRGPTPRFVRGHVHHDFAPLAARARLLTYSRVENQPGGIGLVRRFVVRLAASVDGLNGNEVFALCEVWLKMDQLWLCVVVSGARFLAV